MASSPKSPNKRCAGEEVQRFSPSAVVPSKLTIDNLLRIGRSVNTSLKDFLELAAPSWKSASEFGAKKRRRKRGITPAQAIKKPLLF